ncbi:hypothetical protein KSP39_PZI016173 [Platanthera zijinensis]|uniref:Uncharacterized protein n=1 Tax=Platanthera zijinensis TaxID=2320716 RepID=A0AAP0B695_9ASPA
MTDIQALFNDFVLKLKRCTIEGSQATARQTAELLRAVVSHQRLPYTNQALALLDAMRVVGEQLIAANPVVEGNCVESSFQVGPSKVYNSPPASDYFTRSESKASTSRDVDGFEFEGDVNQLIDEYGGLLQALKRSKLLVKEHIKEIESLKQTTSESAKLIDLKLKEVAKLRNITVIQIGTITFKEYHIKNLEARLQKERELVAKFSKPKSVLPLIDNFIPQKGKIGLGFKGRTRATNSHGKGKAPIQPLASKPPIFFRKEMQPTNRHNHEITHGNCEYGDHISKCANASRPLYRQAHQVQKEFLGFVAPTPSLNRTAGNKVVKSVPKRRYNRMLDQVSWAPPDFLIRCLATTDFDKVSANQKVEEALHKGDRLFTACPSSAIDDSETECLMSEDRFLEREMKIDVLCVIRMNECSSCSPCLSRIDL